MKANEFVKKVGWDAIKHDLSDYFKGENIGKIQVLTKENEYIDVDGDDLKRLVESHELVKEHCGLERAKMYAESIYTAPEVVERMKQAIADVESCQ